MSSNGNWPTTLSLDLSSWPRGDGSEELIEDGWFSGFAPADRPRLAIAVLTVDVTGGGGAVAAPIAGAILAAGL